MMLLEIGETNVAIKADTKVTGKLIADGRLKSEGEGFALFQIVQGRTGISIYVINIISCTEREHRTETKSKVPLTDTGMVSNEKWDIEEREGIIVATIIEVFCRSSFSHCAKS